MINQLVVEDLKRYSFLTKVEIKGASLYMYYKVGEFERFKKLPLRATKSQLFSFIEAIKKETNYYEKKKEEAVKIKTELGKKDRFVVYTH
jgi:hypothetical protein